MDHGIRLDTLSDAGRSVQGDFMPASMQPHANHPSPVELRASNSFESRESRPTSPHNVSSPTARLADQHSFLAVPGARSRAGSFDTISEDHSSSSGTYINTLSATGADDKSKLSLSGHDDVLSYEDALKPDPGTEADFEREDNKLAFTPGQMSKLLNPKSPGAFRALGGLTGLEKGLRTNRKSGLSSDEEQLDGYVSFEEATNTTDSSSLHAPKQFLARTDTRSSKPRKPSDSAFADRKRVFSDNRLPERKAKTILQLAWMAYNDKVLILLSIAAVISLALGLYQTFGQSHADGEARVEWVEGVAIMVAIVIVVVVGAVNDWQKERQFVKLNKKKEDRSIKVVRSGKTQEISVYDILAGDVVLLEPGDMIPVDGIFIEGHNVKCDESSATGESDLLKKTPAEEVFRAMEAHEPLKKMDPFIISGAKVTEGVGSFLVTATGVNSSYGKTMMSLREESEVTPLQSKLNVLAEYIAKLGGAAALCCQNFLNILIVAITIVVVAVPEGLPLAVTLALAFATTKMLKENNLVRVLRSCETMGNATCICSDKTGTLTQNKMSVVAGTLGTTSRFGDRKATAPDPTDPKAQQDAAIDVDDVSTTEFINTLAEDVKILWKDSIAINSTAFEGEEDGKQTFIGSKTETALLSFGRDHLGMGPVSVERSNAQLIQMIPFDSGRKCMGVVVQLQNGTYRLLVKGASEIMLGHCTKIIRDPTKAVTEASMSGDNNKSLNQIIDTYATRSLRTIGLLYRDFEQWPPAGARTQPDDPQQAEFSDVLKDMTFLGVVGIQDPLREGVKEAVLACQKAGVFVRMVTGDNIQTAKAIAEECGIYTEGGVAMEGPEFRKLKRKEMDQIIPKLQVLARSSPDDKRILVKRLKELGETVAVTGDGTNDAPALKMADVGFSMGIAGTEVAKEASAIILMDDNFSSIVKALMWGRAVNDAVKKFLQFQLTVNITAVTLAFVSAVASSDETSVLTAVQLLWVNLIMDTLAALALATDPPTLSILDRKPDPKSAPLITLTMWKMIIGQAIFQLVVTFILYFGGRSILSYDSEREQHQLPTLVFNTFVWMQIFNQLNNRRLDNKFNIFEGIQHNWFFIVIQLVMIGGQVLIIFVGGRAFSVYRLNGAQWGYSIVLGALSIPVGIIIRLIPDELIRSFIPERLKRRATPQLVLTDEENPTAFNQALEDIREELAFIKKFRGGRLSQFKYSVKHPREILLPRSGSRSRSSSLPQTPNGDLSENEHPPPSPAPPSPAGRKRGRSRSNSALAGLAMAGVVAGGIAGGWSPGGVGHGEKDSLKFSRDRSRSDLESRGGLEVHPATRPEDPIIVDQPLQLGVPPSQAKEATPGFAAGPLAGSPTKETR
ncbi:hypothetical protein LTR04_000463 [Oleoguttula sp. CCFEE 6159]|nr:hypothetical protein LTR04_000463 [Oleoguttula sp. CCFEE 6159]